jgi:hypothetical protein
VLDYWARVLEWYDRHVKNAAGSGVSSAETGSPTP